ncbi:uncharacterized protein CC84DRAFT_724515 [Paraphaeosphaeria sporulosa]|uniref:Uncharacterized protein n=1 Tax=Paraphaeosphaeria sporulosa TaxID=1460663 RepID=A0A177CFM9_9PLEO|nr:uncharacterized protein CC84DRAFT_724515 [Paraphaeosphaeria sporulosa]OAG05527.1 hypothetical protein CC84DRAFT_724515 [Paraphaeosphaeria sporulosa]
MCPAKKSDGAGRRCAGDGRGCVFVMLMLAALRADSESCRRRPSGVTCPCTPLPQRYLLHWTPDTSETVANSLNSSDVV